MLLLEYKSSVDPGTPFQLARYMLDIWMPELEKTRAPNELPNDPAYCVLSWLRRTDSSVYPKFSSWSKTELWQVVDVEPMPVFGKFYNG